MGLEALGLEGEDIEGLIAQLNLVKETAPDGSWGGEVDRMLVFLERLEKAEAGRLTSTVLVRAVDGHFLEAHAGDILIVLPKEVRGE